MAKIIASANLLGGNQTIDPPADILAGDVWLVVQMGASASASPAITGFSPIVTGRATSSNSRITAIMKRYTSPSTDSVDTTTTAIKKNTNLIPIILVK